MIVTIAGNVRLRTDDHNFVLEHRVVTGQHHRTKAENIGKERWVTSGYYSSMQQVIKALVGPKMKFLLDEPGEEIELSLMQVLERLESLEEELLGVVNELKKESEG